MDEKQTIANHGLALIGILIVIAVIAVIGGGGLYLREIKTQQTIEQIGIEKLKEAETLKQKIEQEDKQAQEILKENPQPVTSAIDTSDWKTYRNEEYGFEVKYPATMKGNANGDEFSGSYSGNSVSLIIKIVPKKEFSLLHPDYAKNISVRRYVVNGLDVQEYYNNESKFFYTSLLKSNELIEIFAEIGFDDAKRNLDGVLSTFKFFK